MFRRLLYAGIISLAAGVAAADERAFLGSLEGKWTGHGVVRLRADLAPINVSCNFHSTNAGLAFAMRGKCRALILASRSISADLTFNGARYSGIYVGPKGGRSSLVGNRRGNAINLTIHWAKEVNGDRRAALVLEKVGENGMKLMTVDRDPRSGGRVVTSEIDLRRK